MKVLWQLEMPKSEVGLLKSIPNYVTLLACQFLGMTVTVV